MSNKIIIPKTQDAGVTLDAGYIKAGVRSGKGANAILLEVLDEMSVQPPATPKEAETFCRIQIKRCRMNLANAKDRGDKRAVLHLERKLAVYEYLYRLAQTEAPPAMIVRDQVESCPNCRVHAVGTSSGVCPVCGQVTLGEG